MQRVCQIANQQSTINKQRSTISIQHSAIENGSHPSSSAPPRQPDRRRRSGRAAGVGRQGAGRERASTPARRRIAIHVELGGKKQVRVEDDGEGWSRRTRGWPSSATPPARSRRADDLAAIRTLGFRGEALPSIASVSHFVLRTRARGQRQRHRDPRQRRHGRVGREVGAPEGTVVEVNDLFYNLPARRKFLKSDGGRIGAGLAHRDPAGARLSGGRLHADERAAARCCSARRPRLRDRLYQLYGERTDLIEVRQGGRRDAARRLRRGAGGAGADARRRRTSSSTAASSRTGRSRTRSSTPTASASIKERSPEVHLFIEMPPDARRRQRAPDEGGGAVPRSVARARSRAPRADGRARAGRRAAAAAAAGALGAAAADARRAMPGVLAGGAYPNRWIAEPIGAVPQPDGSATPEHASQPATRRRRPQRPAPPTDRRDIRPMIPLGQFRDTFIIAVDDEGIAIIDQHVAHERVLFERVMERLTAGGSRSQRLLVPMVLELSPAGAQALVSRTRRARAARLRARGVRRRHDQGDGGAGAARAGGQLEGAARARRGSRRPRSRRAGAGRAAADRGDHGLPCRGEGELPADATRR